MRNDANSHARTNHTRHTSGTSSITSYHHTSSQTIMSSRCPKWGKPLKVASVVDRRRLLIWNDGCVPRKFFLFLSQGNITIHIQILLSQCRGPVSIFWVRIRTQISQCEFHLCSDLIQIDEHHLLILNQHLQLVWLSLFDIIIFKEEACRKCYQSIKCLMFMLILWWVSQW